jgi:biotin carboxyl carrier protein
VKFKINLDSEQHQVDAAADGTLVVDGEVFQAKVSCPSADRRTVQLGDKTYEVRVVTSGKTGGADGAATDAFLLEIAGERVPVSVSEVTAGVGSGGAAGSMAAPADAGAAGTQPGGGAATAEAAGGSGVAAQAPREVKEGIWAPVPGKIVEVFVKAGDTVKEGDLVLLLEAMKMENELHAPKQATIAAVLVKRGDQAEKGQLLVAFA